MKNETKHSKNNNDEKISESTIYVIQVRLKRERGKKRRIRSMFNKFKTLKEYKYWSGNVLLIAIVNGLIDLGLPYSKDEIISAFKQISIDEFDENPKKEIKKYLLREAQEKSPF